MGTKSPNDAKLSAGAALPIKYIFIMRILGDWYIQIRYRVVMSYKTVDAVPLNPTPVVTLNDLWDIFWNNDDHNWFPYISSGPVCERLLHWGRVTHICVNKLANIGSDNGMSPVRLQAIIWTNAGILLIEPFGTNFSEILIEIETFSFRKMHLKCRLRNGNHFVSASIC